MTPLLDEPQTTFDYSLTGASAALAIEKGLAEADWYQCDVPRETMRRLLVRRDGPAVRDTILWIALIAASAAASVACWGHWWFVFPYFVYSLLYATTSDSRWHESGHGTAFKTDWLNRTLYEVASFMVMRESVVWRWSHTRHHSDTIIVGRDPEIAVPMPPDIFGICLKFIDYPVYTTYFPGILRHTFGRMSAAERTFIPASEFPRVYARARIYLAIYLCVVIAAIYERSLLPLMLVGFPNLFGSWLMVVYGLTQHSGLAENVLDHRLNCRTIYMDRLHRFLYWNMNYHVEHHMFPLVPYHALPELHAAVKDDCPPPYPGILAAWREIVVTLAKQLKDPAYHVKRVLPDRRSSTQQTVLTLETPQQDWVPSFRCDDLGRAEVVRFDCGTRTLAIYRDEKGAVYATDGICTHGNAQLSEGLVIGGMIECPKHNGRFFLVDGQPARPPVCRALKTYPVEERCGTIFVNIARPLGGDCRSQDRFLFRVVSNRNVATFIKELVLEPAEPARTPRFDPGDYLQFEIPAFDEIRFRDFEVEEPYAAVWRRQHVFDLVARNQSDSRLNNYSIASNREQDRFLRFNIRIATPPPGQVCPPGVGSAYMFHLRPGDTVGTIGPFGEFHPRPTQREMVYIGGGAGMAPLRAHISHLLETERCARKIGYWYGARSRQEIFYADYFEQLAREYRNFSFSLALSSPLPEDGWTGRTGFIHEVVFRDHLCSHPNAAAAEYYLCGPPMMIRACLRMLNEIRVHPSHISYDEF